MLPIDPNVRFSLDAGTSSQRHFSATRCESMRILFMMMKNQARHRLKVRAYVGKRRQYGIPCRHLNVNIVLVLVSFGVEGSDSWTLANLKPASRPLSSVSFTLGACFIVFPNTM
jgi:hypothetical protein